MKTKLRFRLIAISFVLVTYTSIALCDNFLGQYKSVLQPQSVFFTRDKQKKTYDVDSAFKELERAVKIALERYSNVHRGKGQHSMVSTKLHERAREIVRNYLNVGKEYEVIFGSSLGINAIVRKLKDRSTYKILNSNGETGLRLGVAVLVVKKEDLPDGIPPIVGGGTVADVGDTSAAWAEVPEKFEPGTPNIVGVITFAKALNIIKESDDKNIFKGRSNGAVEIKHIHDPIGGMRGTELLMKLREMLVGKNAIVPSEEGDVGYINLDNGASTPTFVPIMEAAFAALRQDEAAEERVVADVRDACSTYFNAPMQDYDFIFTSNTTEAVNIAAENLNRFSEEGIEFVCVGTDLEHNSDELPWRKGSLLHITIDENGFYDIEKLRQILKEYNVLKTHGNQRIQVVTVSGSSNVLGTLNNIQAISGLAHDFGVYVHVDAAQLASHRKIDMERYGIDFLSFSGHKMYAPFGSGCLIARKKLLRFDPEELVQIKKSGENNIVGLAAMARSLQLLDGIGLEVIENTERTLTKELLSQLSAINDEYGEGTVEIFGIKDVNRIGNKGPVISFHVKDVPHNIVAQRLAEIRGIGVRSGCFCAHRLVRSLICVRRKARGMCVRHERGPGLVRVSFGFQNREKDIDEFIRVLRGIIDDKTLRPSGDKKPVCPYLATARIVNGISGVIEQFTDKSR